jgi:DHA3 family macrolide efflux protein-like MFS transporter
MAAGMFALSCFGALVSVYVRDVLHSGMELLGALGSLIGAGSILGAVFVQKLAKGRSPARLVSFGMFGIGMFILVLAIFRNRPVSMVCAAGIGVSVAFIIVAAMAMMQGQAPPEMRGRVSSSSMAMIALSQGVAMIFAGGWATRFGIINLFYASAGMLFAVAVGGTLKLRQSQEHAQNNN